MRWQYNCLAVEKRFSKPIQALVDPDTALLLVIGHGTSSIDDYPLPNNGVVYRPDGTVHRQIIAPPYILSRRYNDGRPVPPEGISLVESKNGRIVLWLSFWHGQWEEMRTYRAATGEWGEVVGQYKN